MKVIGARINWSDGYENTPSIGLLTNDKLPRNMTYKSYMVDNHGQTLSSEQMAAVGAPVKATGKLSEILFAQHESGYVRFTMVGRDTDHPKGGLGGTYVVEDTDGTVEERKISSGWMVSPAVVNNCPDLPEITNCTWYTPEYRNVGMAAFATTDLIKSAVKQFLPRVEMHPTVGADYDFRVKGQPFKSTWHDLEQVRIQVVKAELCEELGYEYNGRILPQGAWEKISKHPRYGEISIQPYSSFIGQEFIQLGQNIECSLCHYIEKPDEQQKRVMASKSVTEGFEYFKRWCEHYHCCRAAE